jgi:hypothetical protein
MKSRFCLNHFQLNPKIVKNWDFFMVFTAQLQGLGPNIFFYIYAVFDSEYTKSPNEFRVIPSQLDQKKTKMTPMVTDLSDYFLQ